MLEQVGFSQLAKDYRALVFDFVITELELAMTFYSISTSSSDPAKANRNAEHARRARSSACKAMGNAQMSRAQNQEIDLRLDQLKELSEAV